MTGDIGKDGELYEWLIQPANDWVVVQELRDKDLCDKSEPEQGGRHRSRRARRFGSGPPDYAHDDMPVLFLDRFSQSEPREVMPFSGIETAPVDESITDCKSERAGVGPRAGPTQ